MVEYIVVMVLHHYTIARQRVDFILQSSNNGSDYCSAEEKAEGKIDAKDYKKEKVLQRGMIDLWVKRLLRSHNLRACWKL